MIVTLLFAQAENMTDVLLKGGPFAVVVALAVTGQVRFKPEVTALHADKERMTQDRVRLEAQVDAYAKQYEEVVLPTVHDAISAIRETVKPVEQGTRAAIRVERALADIERMLPMAEKTHPSHGDRDR